MSEPPSTPFALETTFPPVIFSYCTKTEGGRGEERMWQLANHLRSHGIASFNGKQVEPGEDWMQKWLGKMPEAEVCIAMLSGPYFNSGPCKAELYATAREDIPILPVIFETPPPLKKGFFGTSDDEREKGNFVKAKIGNFLPTPDLGLFQDNWEAYGEFKPEEVHKQYAISLHTPPYTPNTNLKEAKQVWIELTKQDGSSSEPQEFPEARLDLAGPGLSRGPSGAIHQPPLGGKFAGHQPPQGYVC